MDEQAYRQAAESLIKDGVVVIPAIASDDLRLYHAAFWETVRQFPEYLHPDDPSTIYVMGAFGALGNPASFHNEMVRHVRIYMMIHAIYLFGQLEELLLGSTPSNEPKGLMKRNLQQLFDRMAIRRVGTTLQRETWHRDQAPLPDPGPNQRSDDLFGGWVNLDLNSGQRFSCIPGTHLVRTDQPGFARETDIDQSKKRIYEVPPGHWVVFFQNILHEVLSGKVKPTQGSPYSNDTIRVFLGFRLTSRSDSLIDYTDLIQHQGVPRLPGGMMPSMYSPNHLSFHAQTLIDWSSQTFRSECLEEKDTPKLGQYIVVHRIMRTLDEYGLPRYPEYTEEERAILQPNRIWVLDGQTFSL